MKIIQWNMNGYWNNYSDLQLLCGNQKPDILCIQETHMKRTEIPKLKNYTWIQKADDLSLKATGGVAIGFVEGITFRRIHIKTCLQAVAARVTSKNSFTICSIYLPPRIKIEYEDISEIVLQLPSPVLLLGDFNAHSIMWGCPTTNRLGKLIEKCLHQYDLSLLNDGTHTHVCSAFATTSAIDLSICTPRLVTDFKWSVSTDTYSSDHFPLVIESGGNQESHIPVKWNTRKANWDKFNESLFIDSNILSLSCDEMVESITHSIIAAANNSIPKTKPSLKLPVPWFTPEVKAAVKKRKKKLRKFKKNMTTQNLNEYRIAKAESKKTITQAKKETWRTFSSQVNKNTPTSTVWNMISRISAKPIQTKISCIQSKEGMVDNENDIVEVIADHFQLVSSDESYSKEFRDIIKNEGTQRIQLDDEMTEAYNKSFSLYELEHSLKDIRSTSPGKDEIANSMLKNMNNECKKTLLQIFNKLWTDGSFPTSWRQAIIIPIIKKGKDPCLPESYRPIALTSCVCKLLEKMVKNRLSWELENKGILIREQNGFRKNRSTSDNLIKLEHDIQKAFAERKHLIGLIFDIKKAYDTTWKQGIIQNLTRWGFSGRMLVFIQNFLKERRFQVKYRNHLSSLHSQVNGVPQGSVLSPLLFLIAMNDVLMNQPPEAKACIYADDIFIYTISAELTEIGQTLTKSIQSLTSWSRIHGFSFAPEKTKAIHFTNVRKHDNLPHLTMMSQTIQYVTHTKFLGLIFDTKLKWLKHIKELKEQCVKKLQILKYLSGVKWGGDRRTLKNLHRALILSKIDYGVEVYAGSCPTYLKILDSVHNLGVRLATGAFVTSPSNSVLVEAGELPLYYRRITKLLTTAVKAKSKTGKHVEMFEDVTLLRQSKKESIPTRVGNALSLIKWEIPPIFKIKNSPPPWTTINNNIFENIIKKDDPPLSIHGKILEKFTNSSIIYTDGSVSSQGVGCACFFNGNQYLYGLPIGTSNYTAEAYAIMMGIRLVIKSQTNASEFSTYVIASDSRSVIQALKSGKSQHPHVIKIMKLLHDNSEIQINIVWVPAHKNVPGNEIADKAAKSACKLPPLYSTLTPQDAIRIAKQGVNKIWAQNWHSIKNNKLREIKFNTTAWPDSERDSRWEEVALCRLRIGHTRFTHDYIINQQEPPRCTGCGWMLSVKHWLTECPSNQEIRIDLPTNLKEIIGENEKHIPLCLEIIKNSKLRI